MTTLATTGSPHSAITAEEVHVHGAARPVTLEDAAALKLVVQDAALAEQWLDGKQWALNWRESDILYQSPRSLQAWENSGTTRANVSRFTVAKHVNALVPQMMAGIFYDTPPFVLRPRPGTTQATVRAKTAVISALLDDIEFKPECERGIESMVNKGTGIWKWGWRTERKIEKKFRRKKAPARVKLPFGGESQVHTAQSDEFEVKEVETTRSRPFLEFCPLGTVLVSPGWRHANQIWRAPYVVFRMYLTFNDLNKLREQDEYKRLMPDEATLKAMCFPPTEVAVAPSATEAAQQTNAAIHHAEGRDKEQSKDPMERTFKVDERWDGKRVMTVIQDVMLIRNEEHGLGVIPALSANWWNIENAGYGLGVGRLVGGDQRVEAGVTNAALDILSMAVNQQYVRSRGANVPTQQIRSRLGGIIDVDGDVDKAFKIMETPKVPPEVWTTIAAAKQSAESVSGADEAMVQGQLPQRGGSSIGRTATGAGNIAAASASRIQGPVGRFVDNVFIPFIIHVDEMVNERMPLSELRGILDEELGHEIELDLDNYLNAKLKYEVLAGVHLAAKKAMAQSLPWMLQIFENPHMLESLNKMGWTVDLRELYAMIMEVSEWRNSRTLIRKMTGEEKKSYEAASNQIPQKTAADLQKISAQHEATKQEIDQKAEARLASKLMEDASARAGGYVERVAAERQLEPFALGEAQYDTTAARE